MILEQFYLKCLAHASYLVGDETTGVAAVVDPQRDVDQYLEFAAEQGLRIEHVLLTHLHADFVAGHLELRDRAGATIYLGAKATAEYAFTPLGDGDEVRLGAIRLRALETPGHTPESISLLVFDAATSADAPVAVLTGDTLFVGDVGRPDLRASLGWSAADLGNLLYDSLHAKLLTLPDASLVYPAHGAGSLCGRALSQETVSTIGEQRRVNYALRPMSKADFVALVTADQPDAPPYFTYDAVLNSKERPTLDETLAREVQPIPLDGVLALQEAGAQFLDTRDRRRVCLGAPEGQRQRRPGRAVRHLGRHRAAARAADRDRGRARWRARVGGASGPHRLRQRRRVPPGRSRQPGQPAGPDRAAPNASVRRSPPNAPAERRCVDVRTPHEREEGTIAGSVFVPLSQLEQRLGEIPRDRPLIVHCAGGYRSSIAASVLKRDGFDDVSEIAGGITAWQAAGCQWPAREILSPAGR